MAEKKAGIIVILSSPSGAGKTTLVKKISSRKKYITSVSHTTRKPRAKEIDGIDYFFINQEEFEKLIHKMEYTTIEFIETLQNKK